MITRIFSNKGLLCRYFAAAIAWLLFAAPVIASDILFKK